MEWLFSIISGIGNVVGNVSSGLFNWFGTQDTNDQNMKLWMYSNYLNQQNQQQQYARDDNAYQRQVADMQKAGLNPLSQFNNPTSSPLAYNVTPPTMQVPQMGNMLQGLSDSLFKNLDYKIKDKALNLAAIKSGVNPDFLDELSGDDELIEFYRDLVKYGSMDIKKNALSSHTRNEGVFSKYFNDVKDNKDLLEQILKALTDKKDSSPSVSPSSSSSKQGNIEKLHSRFKKWLRG